MKKLLILLTLVLISINSIAQDVVVIKHTNYTTHYSKSKMYPVMVEWWLTKVMISCPTPLKRKDNFKPDPKLVKETDIAKDYVGSGYDKGHVMPAADNLCQTPQVQDECFYFSNMIPQPHYSNAGPWKKIEVLSRELSLKNDSIRVWAGAVGSVKVFGPNKVSVPSKTWKVIYIKKTKLYIAYIFPNTNEKISDVETLKVKKEDVEQLTGFKFN
jgi:endonuclease G